MHKKEDKKDDVPTHKLIKEKDYKLLNVDFIRNVEYP